VHFFVLSCVSGYNAANKLRLVSVTLERAIHTDFLKIPATGGFLFKLPRLRNSRSLAGIFYSAFLVPANRIAKKITCAGFIRED
jgi:hypothetical protein